MERIHHVCVFETLTNNKHVPNTVSQYEFD